MPLMLLTGLNMHDGCLDNITHSITILADLSPSEVFHEPIS